jgi:Recombination endonuclease VII
MTTPPTARKTGWRPTTLPGRPPKECVACAALPDGERPRTWRSTDHAPRAPRCATHQRATRKTSKRGRQATYQETNFGLTPAEHEMLLKVQGGVCYVCLYANGSTKALATDHDHACCSEGTSCGRCVRGKLCGPDNKDIVGRIEMIANRNQERPVDVLLRLMSYFEDPPMNRARRQLELSNR